MGNSHLIISKNNGDAKTIKFSDSNAKMILGFGGNFELGKVYMMSKLIVNTSGNNKLSVEFGHLATKSDIFLT